MCYDFQRANLQRKYGQGWEEHFSETTHRRLRSWGLNTIGNWSDPQISSRRPPYFVPIWNPPTKPLEGSAGYWSIFPDVFDPAFKTQLQTAMARETGRSAGDPWCIGYFVDNELGWGKETSLAEATLASPPDQPAKKVFLEDLKTKDGRIENLNAAWGTSHPAWDALTRETRPPARDRAGADLIAFNRRIAETYFKTCREAVKQFAPHQLYLGCRFADGSNTIADIATEFCDVVTYNLNRRAVSGFRMPEGIDASVLIGGFHFGALDRGPFHSGFCLVPDQARRVGAYKAYVAGALDNPLIVGCHWFQYADEPTTGRPLDGENYQIGFIDICDTPYPETIAASREIGFPMYERRLGR